MTFAANALVMCYVVVTAVIIGRTRRHAFGPWPVFLLVAGFYLIVPLAFFAHDTGQSVRSAVAFFRTDDERTTQILLYACIWFFAGVLTGATVIRRVAERAAVGLSAEWSLPTLRRTAWVLVITGIALGGTLFTLATLAGGATSYVGSYQLTEGMGPLFLGFNLLQVGLVLLAIHGLRRTGELPMSALLIFGSMALLSLRFGRRRWLIETALAVALARNSLGRPIGRRRLVLLGAGAWMVAAAVGYARAFMDGGIESMLDAVRGIEIGRGLTSINEVLAVAMALAGTVQYVDYAGVEYGKTIVDAFRQLVPRVIDPTRPLAPGQWFAWYLDPNVARAGGSFGFSTLAEGFMNFYWPGVLLVGVCVGMFVATLGSLSSARTRGAEPAIFLACMGMTAMILLLRGDFASLLKSWVVMTLLPALVVVQWMRKASTGRVS